LPRWREHPGLARSGASGQIPCGLGGTGSRQSAAGSPRTGLLPPVREELQPRRTRWRRRHPRGRTLSRWSGDRRGLALSRRRGIERQAGAG